MSYKDYLFVDVLSSGKGKYFFFCSKTTGADYNELTEKIFLLRSIEGFEIKGGGKTFSDAFRNILINFPNYRIVPNVDKEFPIKECLRKKLFEISWTHNRERLKNKRSAIP